MVPMKDEQGQDTGVDMLVLDCEGLATSSRGFDMDVKVFTLTVLLASSLVYNQVGHISD